MELFIGTVKQTIPSLGGRGLKGRGRNKEKMKSRLTKLAKTLRIMSTDVEILLWRKLRARRFEGIKFRRQQPIENFVVDFVSFEKRIIIELDGGHHVDNSQEDFKRDKLLAEGGFKVLRFWNNEVIENLEGVLEKIRESCLQ